MESSKKNKGGRPPLPENEKRSHSIGTKVNDMEFKIINAKIEEFKMTIYEYLRKALIDCRISAKKYEECIKVVNEFSHSDLMRLCIIKSVVHPRITLEEIKLYKELSTNLRNYGINIRPIAIQANTQTGNCIDYVQTMNEELNKIKELRIEFQNKLKQ